VQEIAPNPIGAIREVVRREQQTRRADAIATTKTILAA
jgi:hypothetical protein